MENNLPQGWELVKLVEQLNLLPTGVKEFDGTKKYFSTGSIHENEFKPEGEFTFTNRPSRANRIASIGDVLQARMKATDKGILIDEKLDKQLFSTGFLQIRPFGNTYNNKLLYYLIKSDFFLSQKNELATGSTQEALTDNGAKEILIPLPPLAEQHRIVAKLDALMQKVENYKQRIENIPTILKRFRQSVLAAAVSGKLTNKIEEENLPEDWKILFGKDVFEFITSGSRGWAEYYSETGKLFIRVTNLDFDTIKINTVPSKNKYVNPPQNAEGTRTKVRIGDILISITGDVGMVGLVEDNIEEAYINQHVCLARTKEGYYQKYIAYYISAMKGGRKYFDDVKRGATKSGLVLGDIKSLPIPLPPLEEQKEIVRRVEQLFAFADKIEVRYAKAKDMLDKMPQSILAKAFRGELVAQDPTDEPASVLLERIKAKKI